MGENDVVHTLLDAIKVIETSSKNRNLTDVELSECVYYLAKAVVSLLENASK